MKRFKTVEEYIAGHPEWHSELLVLRNILSSTELEEKVKWGAPTYTLNNKNVVGLSAFKSYVGLWFFQGSFLKDQYKLLMNAQAGRTRGMRQMRFQSKNEMDIKKIKMYLQEAIQNQKDGKEIKIDRTKPVIIPMELKLELDQDAGLLESFNSLCKSRRREYAEYISSAKREETRQNRLRKIIPMIAKQIGLNDKYR